MIDHGPAQNRHPNHNPARRIRRALFRSYNYADRPLGRFSMYWFARRYYAALVRRFAPPGDNRRLLELGCGLGHLLGLLQRDFACVGVDIAEYSIEELRRNAPGAEGYVMSAEDLSRFADGEFSAVVALHLVEHLPDPADTLRQVNRILRADGLLLLATPNPNYSLRRFKDPRTDAIGKDPTHINVHPPERWRARGLRKAASACCGTSATGCGRRICPCCRRRYSSRCSAWRWRRSSRGRRLLP